MNRTPIAVLIEFMRAHSESSALDDALDALAAAAQAVHPAASPIAEDALNRLHGHLVAMGDDLAANMIEQLEDEDVTA